MSRCFAFGCSFTRWFYPTWADVIGSNFTTFYNYGNGALSNNTLHNRFLEVDHIHKFNSDDTILVGLTGIGRFNFLVNREDDTTGLWGAGDLQNDAMDSYIDTVDKWKPYRHVIKFMRDHYWQRKWGIYHTWLFVQTVKRICDSNNIRHIIIPALDYTLYCDKELLGLSNQEVNMMNDIVSNLTIKESLQEYNEQNFTGRYEDLHPFVDSHFSYVNRHFPEYITETNIKNLDNMLKEIETITDQDAAYKVLMRYKQDLHISDLQKLYGEYT